MNGMIQIGLKNRMEMFWIHELTDTNKLVMLVIQTLMYFVSRRTGYREGKLSNKEGKPQAKVFTKDQKKTLHCCCCHGEGLPSCKLQIALVDV